MVRLGATEQARLPLAEGTVKGRRRARFERHAHRAVRCRARTQVIARGDCLLKASVQEAVDDAPWEQAAQLALGKRNAAFGARQLYRALLEPRLRVLAEARLAVPAVLALEAANLRKLAAKGASARKRLPRFAIDAPPLRHLLRWHRVRHRPRLLRLFPASLR